ncbi:PDZ domain-containing protein [Bacillus aquiflavi]|nr:SepM family pheromone-processing serine protease [Bacillus aquiflavi]UAC49290.1 PDZ domain-containing protein [Bacillus aquiflavi]
MILTASSFYYLPYYVSKPGMAQDLTEIIEVENGYEENGNFMLTTVSIGRANIYAYLLAKFREYEEILPLEAVKEKDETDEEYNIRQLHYMESSKISAIEVAYKKAGIPVSYRYNGVYVLNIIENMPAENKLQPGDRIFKIDQNTFKTQQEFIEYMSNKKEGEEILITYERDSKTESVKIPIASFPDGSGKVGIGIGLVEDKDINVDPKVKVDTEKIGGPSAGLMFSLEIYNQLTENDFTKGYKIAGTGTINPDGTVGRIGGIEQKIVAADKAGAEIFFAPFENGAKDSNYEAAIKTGKDIKTKMKIIPIDSFDEAIHYLNQLESK